MDRTVREKALELSGRLERVEAGDDPLLPGVLRGLRRVIDRYLDGNPPEIAADGGIDPRRLRMREILAAHGEQGAPARVLWAELEAERSGVARETLHRWLAADEVLGLVERHGVARTPSSKWVSAQVGQAGLRWTSDLEE